MKFKKHISIFIALLLLVSNLGMALTVHYCKEKIASVSLKTETLPTNIKKECCKKSIAKKGSCCKDKVFHFQQKSDNLIVKTFSFHFDSLFLIEQWNPIVFDTVFNFKKSQITSYYCDANAPPFYKLYSQYIFYA